MWKLFIKHDENFVVILIEETKQNRPILKFWENKKHGIA